MRDEIVFLNLYRTSLSTPTIDAPAATPKLCDAFPQSTATPRTQTALRAHIENPAKQSPALKTGQATETHQDEKRTVLVLASDIEGGDDKESIIDDPDLGQRLLQDLVPFPCGPTHPCNHVQRASFLCMRPKVAEELPKPRFCRMSIHVCAVPWHRPNSCLGMSKAP